MMFVTKRDTCKKVCFAPEIVVVTYADRLSVEETSKKWWSPIEVTQLRYAAKASSKETPQKTWMTKSFRKAYNQSRQMASCYEDESKLRVKLQNMKTSQELQDWCQYGHCKRGLERLSSQAHNAARSQAVKEARSRVIAMKGCDALLIRETSEYLSRTARIYARLMGQADADAVENVTSVKPDMVVVSYKLSVRSTAIMAQAKVAFSPTCLLNTEFA
jgi:hypothetical protein